MLFGLVLSTVPLDKDVEVLCRQWVATAAHCEANTGTTVRLGEHNRNVPGVADYGSRNKVLNIGVARAITHPNYGFDGSCDIALLRLRAAVNFKRYPHIRPVCLPPANKRYTGKRVVATEGGGVHLPLPRCRRSSWWCGVRAATYTPEATELLGASASGTRAGP